MASNLSSGLGCAGKKASFAAAFGMNEAASAAVLDCKTAMTHWRRSLISCAILLRFAVELPSLLELPSFLELELPSCRCLFRLFPLRNISSSICSLCLLVASSLESERFGSSGLVVRRWAEDGFQCLPSGRWPSNCLASFLPWSFLGIGPGRHCLSAPQLRKNSTDSSK